ncbi:DUF3576 domain-containing protein [Paracoccus sp. Arc7-R13]|uniref:DUF3576 domain-containing protein n=1 Tax=Paracoccus sp. Arc7-R13 TaxID=2500532 RepID=UPI000FDAF6F7|nr:DUF3576 domain-containing protein [Paracoccus sp. Arc7-R13]AZY92407.1 DUF3576 domain-containing protein [Paracoccus sp. Arc7-R13]TYP69009.1 uncharacterized protein DUF3576 [Stutzerimonas stutzeri]
MTYARATRLMIVTTLCAGLAACGGSGGNVQTAGGPIDSPDMAPETRSTRIQDLLVRSGNPDQMVGVNKYLWTASLDVLSFLPVQTIDPFTGVIQTGYGTPPGGGRSYRATIQISDPALDARSLRLALQGPGGAAVEAGTVRAVEDAILTRARQLRIQDGRL